MFARVAPILSAADLAVCHLESAVAPAGQPLSTYPLYGIPAQIADGLASAGYDRCSTASNHTIDRGTGGIDATVGALEQAGLSQAGMARTPDEAVATLVQANGITVAHLAYTYGFNGAHLPRGEPWRSNLIDVANIVAAAADARARGADIVVLNLHWGVEGSSDISNYQRDVADAITRAGAVDLIVGEHAHVIQPIEEVNGTWVVFGMGNFLSNMPTGTFPAKTQDGMIVSVSVREQADGSFAVDRPVVIPTWVDRRDGFVIRPILADLADPGVSAATKDALYASLQRTGEIVGGFVAG
jgi:poly-gamma-glutamate synthesis protein (capsule biosynthesis protein)